MLRSLKNLESHIPVSCYNMNYMRVLSKRALARVSGVQILNQIRNLHQLTFEVTDACNLNCTYCGYGSFYGGYDSRVNKKMSFSTARRIIDYLTDIWLQDKNVSLATTMYISFYGGEPLLNMRLINQVVDYVSSRDTKGVSFVYSMTTNAILLDRYMKYLVEKGFKLLISLDGSRDNHSYRITKTGKNSFDTVIRNVEALRNEYPEYFHDNVNFNSVIHNRNSVEDVYRFFQEEFGKKPMLSELNTTGIIPGKREEFLKTYRNVNESLHQSENYERINEDLFTGSPDIRSLALFIMNYSGNTFQRYGDLLNSGGEQYKLPTGTCFPFSRKMFVTVNGKILPCERISHKYALGEVTDEGVHLDFTEIAERYNKYYQKFIQMCNSCSIRKSCIQCIFQLDDLEEDHPVCHGYMDRERFNRYASGFMRMLEKNPEYYNKIIEEATFY